MKPKIHTLRLVVMISVGLLCSISCKKHDIGPVKNTPSAASPQPEITNKGTVDGAGGGDYYKQLFWGLASEVQYRINLEATKDILSKEDVQTLNNLINPDVVSLEFSDKPLYILKNGEEIEVSALNYKRTKNRAPRIVVYKKEKELFFDRSGEPRGLILHEFLGLAGIEDFNYKISLSYFPPRKAPVLTNYKSVSCSYDYSALDIYEQPLQSLRFRGHTSKATFGDSIENHNFLSKMQNMPPSLIRKAQMVIPAAKASNMAVLGDYALHVQVLNISTGKALGWGAWSNRELAYPAALVITAYLLYTPPKGEPKVVGSLPRKTLDFFEDPNIVFLKVGHTTTQDIFYKYGVEPGKRWGDQIQDLGEKLESLGAPIMGAERLILSDLSVICTFDL